MPNALDRISLGVIGCGRIAQVAHLPAIQKAGNVRLAAVSDASARLSRMVGEQYGVASFTNTDELLDQDLDAVLIAVPDRLHAELGLRAIAAGKHVLLEKPLASTSADARRLVDAAGAAGVKLQTGTMKRHDPGIEYAKANLDRIGPILSMVTWYRVMKGSRAEILHTLFPVIHEDEAVRASEDARKVDAAAYRLATHGAHVFDLLRHLGGDLAWVSAHTASRAGDHSWHGTAGLRDSSGLASFEISAGVHSEWSEGADIYGERGHLRIRSPYVFTKLGSSVELYVEAARVAQRPHFGDTNPYERQVESFARAILGASHKPVPGGWHCRGADHRGRGRELCRRGRSGGAVVRTPEIGIFARVFPVGPAADVARSIAGAGYSIAQLNLRAIGLPTIPAVDAWDGIAAEEVRAAFASAGVACWGVSCSATTWLTRTLPCDRQEPRPRSSSSATRHASGLRPSPCARAAGTPTACGRTTRTTRANWRGTTCGPSSTGSFPPPARPGSSWASSPSQATSCVMPRPPGACMPSWAPTGARSGSSPTRPTS